MWRGGEVLGYWIIALFLTEVRYIGVSTLLQGEAVIFPAHNEKVFNTALKQCCHFLIHSLKTCIHFCIPSVSYVYQVKISNSDHTCEIPENDQYAQTTPPHQHFQHYYFKALDWASFLASTTFLQKYILVKLVDTLQPHFKWDLNQDCFCCDHSFSSLSHLANKLGNYRKIPFLHSFMIWMGYPLLYLSTRIWLWLYSLEVKVKVGHSTFVKKPKNSNFSNKE